MPPWAKTLALIVGLSGYSVTVVATIAHGKLPDFGTLGIPAALIVALAPPIKLGRGRESQTDQPRDEENTDAR